MYMKHLIAGAAVLALGVSSATAKELKITTSAPAKTPWTAHIEKSAELVKEATGGSVTMAVFPASQLGSEFETIKQVARGRIDGGFFSIAAASQVVPEVSLITSPFFWDNFEQADCAMENHMTEIFNPLFEAKGLKITQWGEVGWQILFSKNPVNTPDDIKGVKMRVAPVKGNEILWRGVGAAGVPLSFVETASSLQTGVVDAGELPTISYIAAGVGKVAPYMTTTRHIYQPSIAVMSIKSLAGLSEVEQDAVINKIEPAGNLRKAVRGTIEFFEGKHKEAGGTIIDLSDEERAKWAAIFTPEMQQEMIDSIGGEAQNVYDAMVTARKACSK